MGLFKNLNLYKLKNGLAKTRDKIINSITETISGKAILDEKTIEEIEEILISSDIGFETSERIIERSRELLKNDKNRTSQNIIETIKSELTSILSNEDSNQNNIEKFKPFVILVVGINGAGKTTTIGKLAYNFKKSGLKVIVGAADTFRAAANEQLDIWANRAGVEIVQNKKSMDPSSIVFDTISIAIKNKYDIVLIDTAGRLHNKAHLMDELNKIKRVIKKLLEYAPNETLLVIDGNTGQNAITQVDEFSKVTDVNGIIITKLDGTAKGGIVFQISSKFRIPIKYIGVGESIDDLQSFDSNLFVSAIFEN